MKVKEIKKVGKVKDMTFSTAPKEIQKIISDLHNRACRIYPLYKSNGKRDVDISPSVINFYSDLKEWVASGKKASEFDEMPYLEYLVSERFVYNFEPEDDRSWDDEDNDEDGNEDDDYAYENEMHEMRSSFEEYLEDAFDKITKLVSKQ